MHNLRFLVTLTFCAVAAGAASAADFAGGADGKADAPATSATAAFKAAEPIELPDINESERAPVARSLTPSLAFTARGVSSDGRDLSVPPSAELLKLVEGDAAAAATADRAVLPGADDRIEVADPTKMPYRTIGYVEAASDSGVFARCSGFLVGPRTVLLPAHCIYDSANAAWRRDFVFAPALAGPDSQPFGYSAADEAYVPQAYIDSYDGSYASVIAWDIGVLILREPMGERLGWMPFGADDRAEGPAHLSGYYGDKPFGTMWEESCKASLNAVWPEFIEHDCYAFPGVDGGPLFTGEGDGYRVLGMHLASSSEVGIAIRLTPAFVAWINGVAR